MEQLAIIVAVSFVVISLLVVAVQKLKKRTADLQTQLTGTQQECNELKNKIARLEQEQDGLLTQLTRDAVQFYEDELQFMGAEIHDDLIQRLMEHRLMMEKLDLTEDIAELQAIGLKLKSQFEEVRRAVRRVSKRLLPDELVHGYFSNSLRALAAQMETPGVLALQVKSDGKDFKLDPNHELHLYRIVQELIHNTIKHSLAWHLWIRLTWSEILKIELEDDGRVGNLQHAISDLSSFRTLRMRVLKCGAEISFAKAKRGMLITITYDPKFLQGGG